MKYSPRSAAPKAGAQAGRAAIGFDKNRLNAAPVEFLKIFSRGVEAQMRHEVVGLIMVIPDLQLIRIRLPPGQLLEMTAVAVDCTLAECMGVAAGDRAPGDAHVRRHLHRGRREGHAVGERVDDGIGIHCVQLFRHSVVEGHVGAGQADMIVTGLAHVAQAAIVAIRVTKPDNDGTFDVAYPTSEPLGDVGYEFRIGDAIGASIPFLMHATFAADFRVELRVLPEQRLRYVGQAVGFIVVPDRLHPFVVHEMGAGLRAAISLAHILAVAGGPRRVPV